MSNILQFHGVELIFSNSPNDLILQDINLTITQGELVTIVGPSGCGKSSLLNLAAGFLAPSKGYIAFKGEKLNGFNKEIGLMLQNSSLYPWLNVIENIVFSLRMRKIPKRKREQLGYEYLQKLNLMNYAKYYPYELSGGMKQRVSLARTLIYKPDLILMDEPFAALDAFTKKRMQDLLIELWRTSESTVVFVTHELSEAIKLGTRLIVLSSKPGKIMTDIPLKDIGKINEILRGNKVSSIEEYVYKTISH